MEAALLHPGRGRGEVCLCGMETIAGKGKVEQSRTKARLKQEPGAVQGSGRESNRAVPKPWELFCLSTPSWHDCHSQFLRLKMQEKKGKKKIKLQSCGAIFALRLWLWTFNLPEVFNQKKIWFIPKAQGLSKQNPREPPEGLRPGQGGEQLLPKRPQKLKILLGCRNWAKSAGLSSHPQRFLNLYLLNLHWKTGISQILPEISGFC